MEKPVELSPSSSLILVDDSELTLKIYFAMLKKGGYSNLLVCQDSRRLMSMLATHDAEAILLDLHMPNLSGTELLPMVAQDYPHIPIIVITSDEQLQTAVQCIKTGAFDYVVKPVPRERLLATVRQAVSFRELNRENRSLSKRFLHKELKRPEHFNEIVTNNHEMLEIFQYVEVVAPTKQPLLITGETGVGKELLARAVHRAGGTQGEFVAFNVAGLDDELFSDTLFGHLKGAFTGAERPRRGLVEAAAGGTLFLDEIGDLSLACQVKLLRLLQEREYLPLGADAARPVTARIVAATNRDLVDLQGSEIFRKDLYYRLSAHHVHLPPLRDRLNDLPLLLEHFVVAAAAAFNRKPPHFPKNLIPLLEMYDFPGNIRELRAMVMDAVSRSPVSRLAIQPFEKRIIAKTSKLIGRRNPGCAAATADDETCEQLAPYRPYDRLPTLEQAKQCLIEEALKRTGGNKTLAAKLIGVTRQALNWRCRKQASE